MSVIIEKFNNFISNHSPEQVSRHLREVLLGFIEARLNDLPYEFQKYLWEYNDLFDLLDTVTEEKRKLNQK
jgi:hypothetical protein